MHSIHYSKLPLPFMLGGEKFDALINTLRLSLKHCQQENLGQPFDRAAQFAFAADGYSVLTAFNTEFKTDFKTWLFNTNNDQLSDYVKGVYYPIANYGVLFTRMEQDLERQLVCNDGRASLDITKYDELYNSEAYRRAESYASAIVHQVDWMRELVVKHAKIDLTPFRELVMEDFSVYGKYIERNTASIDQGEDLTPNSATHNVSEPTAVQTGRENNFNNMPVEEVKSYFMRLALSNSKNGNPFLTNAQVEQFIDQAFCMCGTPNRLSFNAVHGDKGKIIGLFHKYYICCISHIPSVGKLDKQASPEKYVKLLTDNFDNWNYSEVKNNFRAGGDW